MKRCRIDEIQLAQTLTEFGLCTQVQCNALPRYSETIYETFETFVCAHMHWHESDLRAEVVTQAHQCTIQI